MASRSPPVTGTRAVTYAVIVHGSSERNTPHARAQSLNLNTGDVVTVDGTGTHGTIGGTSVNNNTTSYNGDSAVTTSGTAAFTLGTGGTLTASVQDEYALSAYDSSSITVTGGAMTGIDALFAGGAGSVTVSGGNFTGGDGGYGLLAFTGAIDLYGAFTGLTPGQTQVFSAYGPGSFFGTLQNNTAGQTFTYLNYGTITLHDVALAAPEPAAPAALGALSLSALILRARKRPEAEKALAAELPKVA